MGLFSDVEMQDKLRVRIEFIIILRCKILYTYNGIKYKETILARYEDQSLTRKIRIAMCVCYRWQV